MSQPPVPPPPGPTPPPGPVPPGPPPPSGPSGPSGPSVIPYVEHHTGPRRVLVLYLVSGRGMLKHFPPTVAVDGRAYVVHWGTVQFEIPADRPVHLGVYVERTHLTEAASRLLSPGQAPVVLTYQGEGRLS